MTGSITDNYFRMLRITYPNTTFKKAVGNLFEISQFDQIYGSIYRSKWKLKTFFNIFQRAMICLTLSSWSSYHIETSPLICSANQWTGFYIAGTLIMRELNLTLKRPEQRPWTCICFCWGFYRRIYPVALLLTYFRPILPSYRNQSIDLEFKSIDWFLYKCNIGLIWGRFSDVFRG